MYKYLIKIDSHNNTNRYFQMELIGNRIVTKTGRVGARAIERPYLLKDWDKLYQKKIGEGYVDRTEYTQASLLSPYKEIEEESVRNLWRRLCEFAKRELNKSYVSYDAVTPQMISEARRLIESLSLNIPLISFNQELLRLFSIVPRKSHDLNTEIASSSDDYGRIIARELDLLDLLEAQVKTKVTSCANKTVLESMGISISPCSETEIEEIKSHLSKKTQECFVSAYKVDNGKEILRQGKRHFLYHGSRNANWYGLITEGNKLHPNAIITGKMFGEGIYFAPQSQKSQNYTSASGFYTQEREASGFLGLYEVYLQNPLYANKWSNRMKAFPRGLQGHDSVWAKAGESLLHDEVVLYSEKQAKLKYLIEIQG